MKNRGKVDYSLMPGNWDYKKTFEEIDKKIRHSKNENELFNPESINYYIKTSFKQADDIEGNKI